MASADSAAFLQRARHEAARYGGDSWVFIRELLQNARDAGATRVWLSTGQSSGRDRVACRDDGCGMTFDHARHFLFALYASSKRDQRNSAGRFGIGFWSVLRFKPDLVVIRSRTHTGRGWEVRLDGTLNVLRSGEVAMDPGTEIILERPSDGVELAAAVTAAVLTDAPFLGRRDSSGLPLVVEVDGTAVRGELELPPPSMSFRRRGLRGSVGLAPQPRVEIFAHGLRVRDASSLEELLLSEPHRRVVAPLPDSGLAPRAMIDSRQLSLVMTRGDAREDAALKRLVKIGSRELRRLIRAELDRLARPGLFDRLAGTFGALRSYRWTVAWAALAIATIGAALAAWRFVVPVPGSGRSAGDSSGAPSSSTAVTAAYRDLRRVYPGPGVQTVGAASPTIELRYDPPTARPFFAVLTVNRLDDAGRPLPPTDEPQGPYATVACRSGCLDVEVRAIATSGEQLPLPLPTGHALAVDAVDADGVRLTVLAGPNGWPLVILPENWSGRLRYRTAPSAARGLGLPADWPQLPTRAADWAASASGMTAADAAASITAWVAREVRYDASDRVVGEHAEAGRQGLSFFERALHVGAGDCDVQNALAAAMLAKAGVPARLAVGWVGINGRVTTGLHAWVEYLGEDGSWRVADASARTSRAGNGDVAAAAPPLETDTAGAWLPMVALVGVVMAGAAAFILLKYRWQRHHHPDSGDSAAGLLRGAAVRPEAFAGVEALFRRRVVPRVGGRLVSLERSRAAARRGELAVGRPESRLAADAATAGLLVLDGLQGAGAVVGDALGAIDLDAWGVLLAESRSDPMLDAVEHGLRQTGESCTLRIGAIGPDAAVLDLARRSSGTRWVVVSESGPTWLTVCGLRPQRPELATLVLGEAVVHVLGLPPTVRSRVLARLARAALVEAPGAAGG